MENRLFKNCMLAVAGCAVLTWLQGCSGVLLQVGTADGYRAVEEGRVGVARAAKDSPDSRDQYLRLRESQGREPSYMETWLYGAKNVEQRRNGEGS